MVSLQLSLSMKENNTFRSNQKRNREEEEEEVSAEDKAGFKLIKRPKLWKTQSPKLESFIELNLDTPLPLEWQRCLDIKSGEIYFYNTMTKARTFKDPRSSRETHRCRRPNLDLELNLMREAPEILGVETEQSADEKEMMAIVCARCYMLVMMSKATPLCPNCKFAPPQGLGSNPKVRFLSRVD
ncbi:uncharacterized protein LOC110038171 [Phalaenopsis equestris]|uniref:uncharacterized protein LOC110038171 n=1 Tax=Phalaenopsis equestris TaxID=78828 RepID=UPI0009E37801|nr:uncharacterized protein LOC110038171 [Phalaenopsis equestris]